MDDEPIRVPVLELVYDDGHIVADQTADVGIDETNPALRYRADRVKYSNGP